MLTVADDTLRRLASEHGKEVSIHLFGQESQPETYAISKADLLLKGEGEEAENFANGSTLSQDAFPSREFDFMLSNPPYGKSWKTDLERMGAKKTSRTRASSSSMTATRSFRSSPARTTANSCSW